MLTATPSTAEKSKTSASTGYLVFVLEILLVLAIAYFFTWPKYQAVQAGNSQLSIDQAALAQAQEQAAAYQSSLKVLAASNLTALNQAIPPQDSTTDLYAYVETLVNASSLTMTAVQITDGASNGSGSSAATNGTPGALSSPAATPTAVPAIPASVGVAKIHLVVTGTNVQLAQLLGSFQNSLRLIDVQGLGVNADSTGLETFTVDAVTYYQQ